MKTDIIASRLYLGGEFMIRIKLSELLGKKKMTRKELATKTNARPNTIGDLYNEKVKTINIVLLNDICKTLDCKIEEILEYVEDGEDI